MIIQFQVLIQHEMRIQVMATYVPGHVSYPFSEPDFISARRRSPALR